MKRTSGYLRLHLPPLLYVPALGSRLERALLGLRGVRRVTIDRQRARLSVYYDPWLTDDRPTLVEIDRQASPVVDRMTAEDFSTSLVDRRNLRRSELAERGARIVYLGLLVWVHLFILRAALRDPIRFWWVWALVGFGIGIHRRQIKAVKILPG
jgi:hypothetical protein